MGRGLLSASVASIQNLVTAITNGGDVSTYARQFFQPATASTGQVTAPVFTLPQVTMTPAAAGAAAASDVAASNGGIPGGGYVGVLKSLGDALGMNGTNADGTTGLLHVPGTLAGGDPVFPWLDGQRLLFLFMGAFLVVIGATLLALPSARTVGEAALGYEGITAARAVKKQAQAAIKKPPSTPSTPPTPKVKLEKISSPSRAKKVADKTGKQIAAHLASRNKGTGPSKPH